MKKVITVILTTIVFSILLSAKEETLLVANTLDDVDNGIQIVYLTIPNLTTKNIENYFDDNNSIIGIYPKINTLYDKKIGETFYTFNNTVSISSNINNFIKFYKQKLKSNNFTKDIAAIDYNGVIIDKVKIYMTKDEIDNFLKNCLNCNYSFSR